ncbi:agmatinase family protein [Thermocladium modestius]|nr:agmatinase family protein [Thermocladium modestius]
MALDLYAYKNSSLFGGSCGPGSLHVMGAPMEDTLSYRPGTRFAPEELRRVSKYIETTPTQYLGIRVPKIVCDVGDLALSQGAPEFNLSIIERSAEDALRRWGFIATIGGEHTVSLGVARAIGKVYGRLGAFVQVDAHLDLRKEWAGQSLSHATFARIINEELRPSYVNVGFRGFDDDERDFLESINGLGFTSFDVAKLPNRAIVNAIEERLGKVDGPVHLSIDVDAFDPSIAPGVGNPESGGLSYADVYSVVRAVIDAAGDKLVAVDIMEYSPPNDVSNMTAVLVLKLMLDIFNLTAWRRTCGSK